MGWPRGKPRQQQNLGQRGENNSQAKLSNDDVREIKVLLAWGFTTWELGHAYDVSHTAIWQIQEARAWTSILP